MAELPIPGDWDEQADGYCDLSLSVPNSPRWKAHVRGALYGLSQAVWDDETGDVEQAAEIGKDIYQSMSLQCQSPSQVPVFIENGTLQSSDNGVYSIVAEDMGGWWFVKGHINHDGGQFLSNDDYELTTEADDYIPEDQDGVTYIYDQGYNLVYNGAHVTEYCGGAIVEFASFAQAFTAYITVGEVCP